MKVLAIVPARGKSKGIPEKNITPLMGRPLITYVLETALSLENLDKIVVSTDCNKIKRVVQDYDVDIMHRSAELATDFASSVDVALEVVSSPKYQTYTHFIFLEPTSPFLEATTIANCLTMFCAHNHIMTYKKVDGIYGAIKNNKFYPFIKGEARRRQDRLPKYKEVSALYGLKTSYFLRLRKLADDLAVPLILDDVEAWDINTLLDLKIAEAISQDRGKRNYD